MQPRGRSKFYWLSLLELGAGSLVMPGSWGRRVTSTVVGVAMQNADFASVRSLSRSTMEMVVEQVRVDGFASRPSRLRCNFAFPRVEAAIDFALKAQQTRPPEVLHEVVADDESQVFSTDWSLLHPENGMTVRDVFDRAERYWLGCESAEYPEMLIAGPIKVIKPIDEIKRIFCENP